MISPSELHAFIEASYKRSDAVYFQQTGQLPDRAILTKAYPATFGTAAANIAAAGTASQQIQIGANGDFFCIRIMARLVASTGTAQNSASVPIPNWRLQITDSGSDENWFSQAADLSQVAAIGGVIGESLDLPYPRFVAGRSTLTLAITGYEAAVTYFGDITLIGVLVKTAG